MLLLKLVILNSAWANKTSQDRKLLRSVHLSALEVAIQIQIISDIYGKVTNPAQQYIIIEK